MSVLELNGRIFDASTTGTLTLTSEGGNATTNVTQGLLKSWLNMNGQSTIAINDSFNMFVYFDLPELSKTEIQTVRTIVLL